MTQHYTTNTVEASAWCKKCAKNTPHRVADRRLQYCLPCFERSEKQSAADKKAAASRARLAAFHERELEKGRVAEPAKPAQGRLF
jgi:hypothetical protein